MSKLDIFRKIGNYINTLEEEEKENFISHLLDDVEESISIYELKKALGNNSADKN